MQYYEKLKMLRDEKELSQIQIGKILQTTQQQYSKYENGIQELPIRHLYTLCAFYNVSADYILGLPKGLPWPR